jgi:hypothetical protein
MDCSLSAFYCLWKFFNITTNDVILSEVCTLMDCGKSAKSDEARFKWLVSTLGSNCDTNTIDFMTIAADISSSFCKSVPYLCRTILNYDGKEVTMFEIVCHENYAINDEYADTFLKTNGPEVKKYPM